MSEEIAINSQFKKGVLELCVLKMLQSKDSYGYELAKDVSKKIDISEGAIYPILRRLSKEQYFETYLKESTEGPSRKYYRITAKGLKRFEILSWEWENFIRKVETILTGDKSSNNNEKEKKNDTKTIFEDLAE